MALVVGAAAWLADGTRLARVFELSALGLAERLGEDSRTGQIAAFLTDVPFTDLLLGRGARATWNWPGMSPRWAGGTDVGYLSLLFFGGIPLLVAWCVVHLGPPLGVLRSGETGARLACAAIALLWGVRMFSSSFPSMALDYEVVLLCVGACAAPARPILPSPRAPPGPLMRVLWFTNIPMPAVDRRTGRTTAGSGHWMSQLLLALRGVPDLELGVATAYPGLPDLQFDEDGVEYFVVGQGRFTSHFGARRADLLACRDVGGAVRPGRRPCPRERAFFGLLRARGLVDRPTVVSLQGLLGGGPGLLGHAAAGGADRRAPRDRGPDRAGALLGAPRPPARLTRDEAEVIGGADAVLGRTAGTAPRLRRSPRAALHHVGELLRPEFAAARWRLAGCRRDRVLVTNAGQPRRGLETLLDAARVWPADPGPGLASPAGSHRSGYGRQVRRRIARMPSPGRVRLLGFLDAPSLARELASHHRTSCRRYDENSSNSLCEAMTRRPPMRGRGGRRVPSLVDDGRTGLLFAAGDAASAGGAARARADTTCWRPGSARQARAEATRRHAPGGRRRAARRLRAVLGPRPPGSRPRAEEARA